MKRTVIILLAALMALVSFAGCSKPTAVDGNNNNGKQPIDKDDVNVLIPDDEISLPAKYTAAPDLMNRPGFTEVFKLNGTDEAGSYYRVYTDFEEFTKDMGGSSGRVETTVTRDTFISDFIVAVYVTVPTGGHTYTVDFAENDSHVVKVEITDTPAEAGTAVTQAFETHCVLVGFDKADYYEDLEYNITVNGEAVKLSEDAEA